MLAKQVATAAAKIDAMTKTKDVMTMAGASTMAATDLSNELLTQVEAAHAGDPDAIRKLIGEANADETSQPPTPSTGLRAAQKTYRWGPGQKYQYWVRRLDAGKHDDVAFIQRAGEGTHQPVLLYGRPGCGKTALIEAAFTDQTTGEQMFETITGTGELTDADFVGTYAQVGMAESGEMLYDWFDGPLTRAIERDVPLFVDEVALIEPKVLSILYPLMDGRDKLEITANPARKGGSVLQVGPNFIVHAACNPNAPGARMSEALLSRFKLHLQVSVDYKLAKRLGVSQEILNVGQHLETKFTNKPQTAGWAPGLRELLDTVAIEADFGIDTAFANLISAAPEIDRDEVYKTIRESTTREYAPLALG